MATHDWTKSEHVEIGEDQQLLAMRFAIGKVKSSTQPLCPPVFRPDAARRSRRVQLAGRWEVAYPLAQTDRADVGRRSNIDPRHVP